MKYLEQRVEELELEVTLLRALIKLQETKTTGFVNKQPIRLEKKDTSHYLNNYPPAPDWRNKEINDYMFNPSVNLLSEPDLETAFASPWDSFEIHKNPLNTVTVNLSSMFADNLLPNPDYVDSFDNPAYYPEYPNIIGSWDEGSRDDVITSWGIASEFDKMDKDFLRYLNSTEKKIEKKFGKIISKFKILNHEWEMDGYGYIVRDEDDKKIIVTDHGNPKVVDKSYLNDTITRYKETIQETERALFLIK